MLYPKVYKKIYHDHSILGVTDILRFNIANFLSKMDNPNKPIFVLTPKGYKKNPAKRVYHLNLIIKFTVKEIINYAHYRIVLTRQELKRIEKVTTISDLV